MSEKSERAEKLIEEGARKLTLDEYDAIAQSEWEKGVKHGQENAFFTVEEMLKKKASEFFFGHHDKMADQIRNLITKIEEMKKSFDCSV